MKAGDQLKDIFILGTESEYKAVAGIVQQENDKVHTSRLEKLPVGIPGKEEYEADLIICEGNLSFKEIIDQVPALASKYRVWFHASGSRSVITSNSKKCQGYDYTSIYNHLDAWVIFSPPSYIYGQVPPRS